MAGIEENGVSRRVKDPMDGDSKFNYAQVGAKMPTALTDRSDQESTNLTCQPITLIEI
jgi:hypothetical protein